ncbi:MAG: UDP-2,3-diacylglucosamine diphosphatase [Odoribacteraceae bacterium]|jgi:UDP-2,3-diacylglucosamine pyrophosphatase LpxH|nr:UDP-2,3-diacylglucosamine diphosphatase [Odoribacteraceae bacterium]
MKRNYYSTVVISDVHLGTSFSKTEEVANFLKSVDCKRLILNGDIIDGWHLRNKSHKVWKGRHLLFFRVIMKMMENHGTEVIYVRGNHDDFLDALAPVAFYNLRIVKDFIHASHGKRYYVTHGDVFDSITSRVRWLSRLGDAGYTLLLHLNKYYNRYRNMRGKPYYSFSRAVKDKVKSAVSYISDFEESLASLARARQCQGVICGHIHRPEDKYYGAVRYLNSGDWVESLSALVEDEAGEWKIVYYDRGATARQEEEVEICCPAAV